MWRNNSFQALYPLLFASLRLSALGQIVHTSRHTWATIATNDAGVDKFTVHTALNHVDEKMKVTDLYIKKSWDPIEKANRKVLDFVKLNIGSVEEPKKDKFLLRQKVEQMPKQKGEQK